MPTKNPRIGVTLSDELFDLVSEVAEQTGRSMSGLMVEVLEENHEMLEQIRGTWEEESRLNREFCRRYGERTEMTLRELQELASARPTSKRQRAA